MIRRFGSLNGIGIAYAMGLTNALLAVVYSFGLNLSDTQRSSIVGLVNAVLVVLAHASRAVANGHPPAPPAPPGPGA